MCLYFSEAVNGTTVREGNQQSCSSEGTDRLRDIGKATGGQYCSSESKQPKRKRRNLKSRLSTDSQKRSNKKRKKGQFQVARKGPRKKRNRESEAVATLVNMDNDKADPLDGSTPANVSMVRQDHETSGSNRMTDKSTQVEINDRNHDAVTGIDNNSCVLTMMMIVMTALEQVNGAFNKSMDLVASLRTDASQLNEKLLEKEKLIESLEATLTAEKNQVTTLRNELNKLETTGNGFFDNISDEIIDTSFDFF